VMSSGVDGLGPGAVGGVFGKAFTAAKNLRRTVGRAKNKLTPDRIAEGPHTAFKRGPDGKVSNYATYEPNPHNPSGFQELKRVDVIGKSHRNPDGTLIPTPHVREPGLRGVRPASPEELPL
jgi:hypothetical protein